MRIALLLLCLFPASLRADQPAPSLAFEAGTILAGGHELAESVVLPAMEGPVSLRTRDGSLLRWRIAVGNGETRLMLPDGRWAAKAEYTRRQHEGRIICQIYQTYWSPEWAVRGGAAAARPDYRPADDRVYAFREAPCPSAEPRP